MSYRPLSEYFDWLKSMGLLQTGYILEYPRIAYNNLEIKYSNMGFEHFRLLQNRLNGHDN